MDYKKQYINLIKTRLNRVIDKKVYYEKHHIIPKSWGGTNKKENLIKLTAREHYIAHWLLFRMRPHSNAMAFAFWKMSVSSSKYLNCGYTISSRAYAEAKKASSKAFSKLYTGKKLKKNKEWILKNSKSIKKKIYQFTMNGKLIKEWNGAIDVENELGFSRKGISSNLRGKSKSAYGYIWSFDKNKMNFGYKPNKNKGYKRKVIDISTNIIYESISKASKELDINARTIVTNLRGNNKTNLRYYEK